MLQAIKFLLCNSWLVFSFIPIAGIFGKFIFTIVKRVMQHPVNNALQSNKLFDKAFRGKLKFSNFFKFLFWATIFLGAFIMVKDEIVYQLGYSDGYYKEEYYEEGYAEGDLACNVTGIELHGELVTYISSENLDEEGHPLYDQTSSEDIVYAIESAENDPNTKAILLEVDSYGGGPVGDEGKEV